MDGKAVVRGQSACGKIVLRIFGQVDWEQITWGPLNMGECKDCAHNLVRNQGEGVGWGPLLFRPAATFLPCPCFSTLPLLFLGVRTLNFLDGLLLAPSEWWGAVCVCVCV